MDLMLETFIKWEEMGNNIMSYDDENDNYIISFVNSKTGETEGKITVYKGQGIGWNLPKSLFPNLSAEV